MADDVLDLEALLAPVGEAGAGVDLRDDANYNSIYQRLRTARNEATGEERRQDSGDEDAKAGVADGWRDIRRLSVQALETETKDFQIACLLTEALVRLEGLAGFVAGTRLRIGLLQQYWDAGHPQPDDEGMAGRSIPIGGLSGSDADGTAMKPLRRLPLFRRPSGEPFSLFQYEASEETAGLADTERRERRYEQGVVPLDKVQAEATFGPSRASLYATAALAAEAREAWQALQDELDVRFGDDAPPTRRVAEVLDRMVKVARLLGGEVEAAATAVAGGAPDMPGEVAAAAPGAGGFGAPSLANREQALRTLEQLAGFFQKSEPHSFLAYTLADAARRGRMTLPDLLSEVMADEGARIAMLTALGIRPTAMDASE